MIQKCLLACLPSQSDYEEPSLLLVYSKGIRRTCCDWQYASIVVYRTYYIYIYQNTIFERALVW